MVVIEHFSLTARSVIATTLLGAGTGARLPVAQLVRAGSLFGVSGGAIRTAASRMVADGELDADDDGYHLAGDLLEREQRVSESQMGRRGRWTGAWEIAVVRDEPRPAAARRELRSAAEALRFAELREGTWVRPANLEPSRQANHQATLAVQCIRFAGALTDDIPARTLFDLDSWADRARRLLGELQGRFAEPAATAPALTAGFEIAIAVVRQLQTDPLLPDELLPRSWPGQSLRDEYERYDRRFKRALAHSLRA
jgi:phenylacetic acid degradation operon negative regulatory protein